MTVQSMRMKRKAASTAVPTTLNGKAIVDQTGRKKKLKTMKEQRRVKFEAEKPVKIVAEVEEAGEVGSSDRDDGNESEEAATVDVEENVENGDTTDDDNNDDGVNDDVDKRPVTLDPYSFEDGAICKNALSENRWRNKQRTLVLCSRGVAHRHRHLMEDIKCMLPHAKSEAKWEKRGQLSDLNDACEMQSCNNCIYFESRKSSELYMWLSRTPNGPSVKFQVLNIHTLAELKLSGNCLRHSRPLIIFSREFDERIELQLMKELIIQAFGIPRNHPKSKPFYDHVASFIFCDDKIFFRHYQISPKTDSDHNKPERQLLTEIGPRFVLDPIKVFDGSFSGTSIYQNNKYLTPTKIRRLASRGFGSRYASRKADQTRHQIMLKSFNRASDALDPENVFATLNNYNQTDENDAST